MSGKFKEVMRKAKDEKSKAEPKSEPVSKDAEKIVNLCIKIPKSQRKAWTLAATEQDLTLKDLVINAVEDYLDNN